jgi:hypothetical protein
VRRRLEALDRRAGLAPGSARWHREPLTREQSAMRFGQRADLVYVPVKGRPDRLWVGRKEARVRDEEQDEEQEEELHIALPYTVTVTRERDETFRPKEGSTRKWGWAKASYRDIDALPRTPCLYFIYPKGSTSVHYVGKALNLRERFMERLKAFEDFRIAPTAFDPVLEGARIEWRAVQVIEPAGDLNAASSGLWREPGRGAKGKKKRTLLRKDIGALAAVEQYYIRTLKPAGNDLVHGSEPVKFEKGGTQNGSLNLQERTMERGKFVSAKAFSVQQREVDTYGAPVATELSKSGGTPSHASRAY